MKKIVLTFGLIAGLICGGMFFITMPSDGKIDFENGQLYGYITMFIALSTIFFAVRQYRDNYNGGVIKFGKAFLIGLYITLVATVIYVIAWELYFNNFAPDFMDQYIAYMRESMSSSGLSETEIDEKMAPQVAMFESYGENTIMRMGLTSIEIIPVGLLISLISGLIYGVFLKKKPAVGV